jgi:hypothetical protein
MGILRERQQQGRRSLQWRRNLRPCQIGLAHRTVSAHDLAELPWIIAEELIDIVQAIVL